MKKRVALVVLGLIVVIAILAGIKTLQIRAMIDNGKKFVPPPETVTSALVRTESWETALTATGSLSAVQGVTVAAEMPGKVVRLAIESGKPVQKGDLLLCQDTSSEEAQLLGATAQATLAHTEEVRAAKMLFFHTVDYMHIVQVLRRQLQRSGRIGRAGPLFPQYRGAPFRRDHRIISILQHIHPVPHTYA